jgi:hypothetical protein
MRKRGFTDFDVACVHEDLEMCVVPSEALAGRRFSGQENRPVNDAAISCSLKDSEVIEAIVEHAAGFDWWFDRGEEDSIPRGHPDWFHWVEESIADAAVLLILLSDRWTRSEICLKESRFAISLGKRIVVVVHPDHSPNTPVDRIFRSPKEGWPEAPGCSTGCRTSELGLDRVPREPGRGGGKDRGDHPDRFRMARGAPLAHAARPRVEDHGRNARRAAARK